MRSKFLEDFMRGKVPDIVREYIKVGDKLPVNDAWRRDNHEKVIAVLKYLEDWDTCNARGSSEKCSFCGETIRNSEYTKDVFCYPASYLHNIWNHNVTPDARLIRAAKESGF